MRAVVHDTYGPVEQLRLTDVPEPEPGPGQVLLRVAATSVHVDVWHTVTGLPYAMRLMGDGLRRPRHRVPGTDAAGLVEAVGPGVTALRVGQRVWGETVAGMQWRHGGAWAELATAPVDGLVVTDEALDDHQAAALGTPALLAWDVLVDQGRFVAGQAVLVNGAAGGLGGYVVQLARALGASRVTGVDAGDRLDLVRSYGADRVCDYTVEDPTRLGPTHDLVVDVASTRPFRDWRRAVTPDGAYVRVGHDHYGHGMRRVTGSMGPLLGLLATSPFRRQLRGPARSTPRPERLARLSALASAGDLRPHVGPVLPLADVVPAMQLLVQGRARGRVLLVP